MQGPLFGIVTNNKDPDKLGRLKVKIDYMGEKIETDWIPTIVPIAGVFCLPEVNDQVLVAFMGDSAEYGVVIGSIWTNKILPPETKINTGSDLNKDGKNNLRFIKTRAGNMIILDDKKGEEKIQIIVKGNKTKYEFSAKDKKITMITDVNMVISAKKGLNIKAEKGTITVKKALKISADALSVESKSKDITIKASQNITVQGSNIKLN